MKKIEIKREIIEYVSSPTRKFAVDIFYETSDGKIFTKKGDAKIHEERLALSEIESKDHWFPYLDEKWYRAKNQKELELILVYVGDKGYNYQHGVEKIDLNEWFCVYKYDGGDSRGSTYYTILKEFKLSYAKFLKKMEGGK